MIADFNKKGNREFFTDKLLFKTVGIIVLIFIIALIFADIKIYKKKRDLASQVSAYQRQIENIKKSSQTLQNEIANSNNVDYLEKLGYEQFNQARPGETEYMFVDSSKKTEAVSQRQNFWDMKYWSGWVGQSWNWIKNRF